MIESKLGIKMYESTDPLSGETVTLRLGEAINCLRIEFNKLVRVVEAQQEEIEKLKTQLSK